MPNEYNPLAPSQLLNRADASASQQYCFDVARSQFTAAISKNLDAICEDHPEIAHAYRCMTAVLSTHRTRQFKVFRPEDASLTIDADSNAAFVR